VVLVDAQVVNKKTRHSVNALKSDNFQNLRRQYSAGNQLFQPGHAASFHRAAVRPTDSVRPRPEIAGEGALEALQHLKPEDEVAVMGIRGVDSGAPGFNHGPVSCRGCH